MRKFKRYYIVNIGVLTDIGDIVKFSFSVPSICKRLIGAFLYTRDIQASLGINCIAHLSLSINNKEKNPISQSFNVLKNDIENFEPRILYLDEEIIPAQFITGYIECIVPYPPCVPPLYPPAMQFNVELYLKFECEEPLTDKQRETIKSAKELQLIREKEQKEKKEEDRISQKEPTQNQIRNLKQQIII